MKSPRSHTRHFKFIASAAVLIASAGIHNALGQNDAFSRGESGTDLWWNDSNLPWFIGGGNRNRPDWASGENRLKIGHNNNTTMRVNGADFFIGSLEIQGGATTARIYNSEAGGAITIKASDGGFTNNSTANQTWNPRITIDPVTSGANVFFRANSGSSINTFNGQIVITNSSLLFVGGSSSSTSFVFAGGVSGNGGIVKQDDNLLRISTAGTFSGGLFIDRGVVNLDGTSATLSSSRVDIGSATSGNQNLTAELRLGGSSGGRTFSSGLNVMTNSGSATRTLVSENTSGVNTWSANITNTSAVNGGFTVNVTNSGGRVDFSGAVSGTGSVTKTGSGTLTFSGSSANTYSGTTTVSGGTLQLNKTAGTDAIAGAVTVNSGAVLLLSASNQLDSEAGDTVTLSGGTLRRGAAVSDVMGNLNVSSASTIDFGSFAGSTFLQFGTVTGGSFLTINSFLVGNEFRFSAANFGAGETIANSFNFTSSDLRSYSFGSGTFTITAIPEPATILAALGLAALLLWPVRRGWRRTADPSA